MIAGGINLKSFFTNNRAAGVEVRLSETGITDISFVILARRQDHFQVHSFKSGMNEIIQLKEGIPPDVPVNLVLSGKGILHKIINAEKEDVRALLHHVLPNANPDEFYIEQEPMSADSYGKILLSVLRKKYAEDILRELTACGLFVVSASMGPFCIKSILPHLNNGADNGEAEFNIAGRRVIYTGDKIKDFQLGSDTMEDSTGNLSAVQIGSETISAALLVPFAAAWQYIFAEKERTGTGVPLIKQSQEEFAAMRNFKVRGAVFLLFFMSLLLVNFYLFSYFSGRVNKLEVYLTQNTNARYEEVKKELSGKRLFLKSAGLLEQSKISFYANRIAAVIPEGVRLTQMNLQPAKRNAKNENEINFNLKVIYMEGLCRESSTLNEWIKNLKGSSWIKDITIVNYTKASAAQPSEFSVEVTVL